MEIRASLPRRSERALRPRARSGRARQPRRPAEDAAHGADAPLAAGGVVRPARRSRARRRTQARHRLRPARARAGRGRRARGVPGRPDRSAARSGAEGSVMVRRLLKPSVVVGALSLAAVVGLYWIVALQPGTNPGLVPPPPTIVETFFAELRNGDLLANTAAS